MTGWECPKCHQVFAPFVDRCDRCIGVAPVEPVIIPQPIIVPYIPYTPPQTPWQDPYQPIPWWQHPIITYGHSDTVTQPVITTDSTSEGFV